MREKATMRYAIAAHLRGIKELHKVSPRFFPLLTLHCILRGITPYLTVFFSARILKELATLRREEILWQWVIAGVFCVGAAEILKALLHRRYNTLLNDLYGRKEILFIHKMFSLDYSELDKQENHDLRSQIRQNEGWGTWGLMKIPGSYENFATGVIGLISGVVLTASLFTSSVPESAGGLTVLNHPVFILALVFLMISISVLAGKLSAAATMCWSDHAEEATFGNRVFDHFGFIGMAKERSIDIRMNHQQNLISAYWSTNSTFGVNGPIAKTAQGKMGIYAGLGVCITTLITGAIYVFTCLKAWGGAFDVGSITQHVGAATAMVGNVFALTSLTGVLKTNADYLDKTFEFLDIPNAMYQGSLTTEKRADRQYEVEFRDVSFRYPGTDQWALRHVSRKFAVGSRLAVVGENGSGKTTFIKLLCRLYDPQEGEILLNGIDIRKYDYRDYMAIFSVVFQDFQLLSQPLGENVAGSVAYDRPRADRALRDAGFGDRLDTLPQGLDTQLYRDFGEEGVELSGGEAQKVAIARALYKDAPFLILDEPTAALDPMAEAEIYEHLGTITGDRTAIYISHRLSSCRFCDEILVFDHGQIVQQGSHDNLLADTVGPYAALWHAQAQYYTQQS
jgi:ATP-binding cassette subfamily B protein